MFLPRFRWFAALVLAALAWSVAARSQPEASLCTYSAQAIPQRLTHAPLASEFVSTVGHLDERERDRAIRAELMAGNLPHFLRSGQPVSVTAAGRDGGVVRLTLCVLADYLSIGTDHDFLIVPMGLATALAIAAQFGFVLPTPRMVNLIYQQSVARLKPQPLPAGDQMRSTDYYVRHDALVKQQRASAGATAERLTAGHKKDLVLSSRLWSRPGRVAIYGWHRHADAPIQTLSTVHGAGYADYSHGVRLVSNIVYVNGKPRSIFDVLTDQTLAPLLSDEGLLPQAAELFGRVAELGAGR